MRSISTELVHLLFSLPMYLCALLVALWLRSFLRRSHAPGRRVQWGWAVALAAAYVASIPATSNRIVTWIEQQNPELSPAQVQAALTGDAAPPQILVLSGGWFRSVGGGYEVVLAAQDWQRIRSAVALWQRIGGSLMFSGAPLPDGSDSVAQRMAAAAVQMGVPPADVRAETRSQNTAENLRFSQSQFGLQSARHVVLVTSALHMPRAVGVARRLGINAIPYPCDFRGDVRTTWREWLPSNEAGAALEEALHETVGLLAYKLRGQI